MASRAVNEADTDDQRQRVPKVPGRDVGEQHGEVSECDLELSRLKRPIRPLKAILRLLLSTWQGRRTRRRPPIDLIVRRRP